MTIRWALSRPRGPHWHSKNSQQWLPELIDSKGSNLALPTFPERLVFGMKSSVSESLVTRQIGKVRLCHARTDLFTKVGWGIDLTTSFSAFSPPRCSSEFSRRDFRTTKGHSHWYAAGLWLSSRGLAPSRKLYHAQGLIAAYRNAYPRCSGTNTSIRKRTCSDGSRARAPLKC